MAQDEAMERAGCVVGVAPGTVPGTAASQTEAADASAGPTAVSAKRPVLLHLSMPFYPVARPWTSERLLVATDVDRAAYVDALTREALGAAPDFADCRVPAMLVGGSGGVAAHMADDRLGALLRDVRRRFDLACDDGAPAEVTLTAHPGMVSAATLDACRKGHVTRLYLGFGTSSAAEARELGRFMGPEAMEVTRTVVGTFRVDLAFGLLVGIPGQTARSAVASVEAVLGYGAAAVSLREFELDPASALAADRSAHDEAWRAQAAHRLPDAGERAGLRAAMEGRLRSAGFAEYLPGEWALPGRESRYLQLAAQGSELLGFGLGACTRFGGVEARNTDDLATYLRFSDDPERCIAAVRPLVG